MKVTVAAVALACSTLGVIQAQARVGASNPFWSTLDQNGVLSAGWVQVLPVLATACKMKLDSRELNAKLVDISQTTGNTSYATDLYWHLYLMDRHRAKNACGNAWKARFGDNQKEACDTAENLWGNAGQQFPGVLRREAALDTDTTSTIPPNAAPNCR
jgi:hypothetical protein